MQYYKKDKNKEEVTVFSFMLKTKKSRAIWIFKITLIAFLLSLFLSIFSEMFLSASNIIFATLLLIIFMFVNIVSDMIGLAIVSCQVEELKRRINNAQIYNMCLALTKNSDKVSSILCDVIGDACGILCGVSGSILSIIISQKIASNSFGALLIGATISALIVGLTVFFKAVSKKYAVINSVNIVRKIAKLFLKLKFNKLK